MVGVDTPEIGHQDLPAPRTAGDDKQRQHGHSRTHLILPVRAAAPTDEHMMGRNGGPQLLGGSPGSADFRRRPPPRGEAAS